jgi:hypothetical protein
MTAPPSPSYETPDASPSKQAFTSAYFTLRGSRDLRDLINVSPQSGGAATYWGSDANMVSNGNLPYRGDLIVQCVPRGSTWTLTLSDISNLRAPAPPDGVPFGSYPDYRHGAPPRL